MNKQDIIEAVYNADSELTKSKASQLVDVVFDTIKEEVNNGEKISIAGFGIFVKKIVNARTGRNPRTGNAVEIPKHGKVKFVTALSFKDLVR